MSDVIQTVHLIVAEDETGEGLMAHYTPQGWMPLVAADPARLQSLIPIAQMISKRTGKPFRVIRMSVREDVTAEAVAMYGIGSGLSRTEL